MAYDMNGTTPSPTAALTGSGFTDLDALQEYTAVVPASKVILGVPYYGYDWPTTGPGLGATATGPKTPLSYAQIAAANHPVYWDPATQTAWTSYQVGSQWHQTWFDDPTSLALKAQLASWFHIAGLGVWALGMDGNNPAMLAALLGNAPVVKDFVAGPGRHDDHLEHDDHDHGGRTDLQLHRRLEPDRRGPHAGGPRLSARRR